MAKTETDPRPALLFPEHPAVADALQRAYKGRERARGLLGGLNEQSSRRAQLRAELAQLDADHAEAELIRRVAMWGWNEAHDAMCDEAYDRESEWCPVHRNPYVARRPETEQ